MPSELINSTKKLTPVELFDRIAHEEGAAWLDSSLSIGDRGKSSLIFRNPVGKLELNVHDVSFSLHGKTRHGRGIDNFLKILSEITKDTSLLAVGYISYEASLPFVNVAQKDINSAVPSAFFYLYDSALRFDSNSGEIMGINSEADELLSELPDLNNYHVRQVDSVGRAPEYELSYDEYSERIKKIKWHIKEGDIYQANFTTRIIVPSTIDPYSAYRNLRRLNPAPYSAYVNAGKFQLLSSSPERMFLRQGENLTSGPIKGTIAAGDSEDEQIANRSLLLASEKDKAELLMIVDLLRNDLGKVAKTGSVKVDRLFGVEMYSSLIHLVGDISCKLREEIKISDIFKALLPGGSITGTPKQRAVEIIQSTETVERGIYTGCIGYIHGDTADFSVAIRTMMHYENEYRIHAGGGIIADSLANDEYEEMMLKAMNLLKAVGICPHEIKN